MSIVKDQIVFKGRTVYNQIKLRPTEEDKWPKFIAVNESSSRLTYYQVDVTNDADKTIFTTLWNVEFDKIHDFGFIDNYLIVADGELSEKQLVKLSLDDQTSSQLDTSNISSKGAWKMSCLDSMKLIALYVKHSNDLHFYQDDKYAFLIQSPFSGQVSQLEITSDFLVVGLLEQHLVQIYKYNLPNKKINHYFKIEAFWGNFGVYSDTLYTSIMGSQKEVVITFLPSKSQQQLEAETKFVPLASISGNLLLTKERHSNTTVHLFRLPPIQIE
ncbi:uncharacterized protein LOC142339056 [Convolutriloba macropyga]|uniref:uncharacterized protein LOC142339056 n=1 Tax=Convolutriloba macropyga TaxID=536237 RepID=UPI003F520C3C